MTPLQAAAYVVPVPWNGKEPELLRPTRQAPVVVSVMQANAGRWVWLAHAQAVGPNARALVAGVLNGVGSRDKLDVDVVELVAGLRDRRGLWGTVSAVYLTPDEVAGLRLRQVPA